MTKQRLDQDDEAAAAESAAPSELPADPICVRIATAVKLTGIGRSTLYELIGAGELETVKVGRSTFILYRSLRRLFEKH